jgi:hypothetical protein
MTAASIRPVGEATRTWESLLDVTAATDDYG